MCWTPLCANKHKNVNKTWALPQKTGGNKTCKRHINRYMYIHQCFRVLLFLSFTLNTFWGKGLPNTNIFLIKDIIVPDQNVYNMVWPQVKQHNRQLVFTSYVSSIDIDKVFFFYIAIVVRSYTSYNITIL
jgi:hypothetical protein